MVKQEWGCIYRLTCMITSMVYIGKSVEFLNRMNNHKTAKDNYYIHRAIRKYGWENFKVEIIIDDVPEEDLNNLEISYIDAENTMRPNGYNLTKGGEGCTGYRHTEETRRKYFNGRYGCVSFNKQFKKWQVTGTKPEQKHIGYYFTKEKAEEALDLYNNTGERMPSDRTRRKRGTIRKTKNGKRYQARININRKPHGKTFDTVEQCEEWLKSLKKSI